MKVILLILVLGSIFELSESHGFYPGIFMKNRKHHQTNHAESTEPAEPIESTEPAESAESTEMENELTKEEIDEEVMAKIRQLMKKLAHWAHGKGEKFEKEIPLLISRLWM